jgi:8-oxo-dGTP pyrophosphatase MutT (NUDIX family)
MFRSRSQKYKRQFTTGNLINTGQLGEQSPEPTTYQPQSRMTLFCMNCGKNNHGYPQCQEPLSSYGIICFYRGGNNAGEYQVVMVRRQHTMNYVEFLRGKYDVNGAEYLVELFCGMTRAEIEFITTNPNFEVLRRDLGMDNNWKRAYKAEYDNSELKFNYILNLGILANIIRAVNHIWGTGFTEVGGLELAPAEKFWSADGKSCGARLDELRLRFNPSGGLGKLYEEPEWGIPKGRRDNKETDLQCAIREFQEETQITGNELTIYKNILPLEEVYVGNNGIRYRHVYFIGELKGDITPVSEELMSSQTNNDGFVKNPVDRSGFVGNPEIGGVRLFQQQDALGILRDYCTEKKKILQKAFYIINNVSYYFTRGSSGSS